MARRNRPRVVWLPQDTGASVRSTASDALGVLSVYQEFNIEVAGDAGFVAVAEIPLTDDGPPTAAGLGTTPTLADLFQSGYRLRRIVGKIFVAQRQQAESETAPFLVAVTAGIIVRRVNENGISFGQAIGLEQNVSPGDIEQASDPWVWRRTWMMHDNTANTAQGLLPDGPTSNYFGYGAGLADGPHIDAKTARIVSQEERLFLDVSSTIVIPGDALPQGIAASTHVITDLRLLVSMRTTSGNRRNASR